MTSAGVAPWLTCVMDLICPTQATSRLRRSTTCPGPSGVQMSTRTLYRWTTSHAVSTHVVNYEAEMHLLFCRTGRHRVVGLTCHSSSVESCCQGCWCALCFTFPGADCSTDAKQDVTAAAAASLTSNQTCVSHTFNQTELEGLAEPYGKTQKETVASAR